VPYYRQAQGLCGLGPFDYEAQNWISERRPGLPLDGGLVVSRIYQFGTAEAFLRHIPQRLAAAPAVTLVTHASVRRIETDRHGESVVAVHAVAPNGRQTRVRARRFVLAAGAMENARLLLATDDVFPEGVGTASTGWGRASGHP